METTIPSDQAMPEAPAEPESTARPRCRRSLGGLYIAAIVIGFIVFWPIGLALLAWGLWRDQIRQSRFYQRLSQARVPDAHRRHQGFMARRPSNTALAAYLEQEQDRLKTEQEKLDELVKAFEAFKDAERRSTDQRDFDTFMQQQNDEVGDQPQT